MKRPGGKEEGWRRFLRPKNKKINKRELSQSKSCGRCRVPSILRASAAEPRDWQGTTCHHLLEGKKNNNPNAEKKDDFCWWWGGKSVR